MMSYMLLDPWHLKEFHSHSRNFINFINFINFWTIVCPVFSYSYRNYSYKENLGRTKQYKGYFVASLLSFLFVFNRKIFPVFFLFLSIIVDSSPCFKFSQTMPSTVCA